MSKNILMLLTAVLFAVGLAACEREQPAAPADGDAGQTMEQPAEDGTPEEEGDE